MTTHTERIPFGWRKMAGWLVFAAGLVNADAAAPSNSSAPTEMTLGRCHFILHSYRLSPTNAARINAIIADLLQQQSRAFDFEPAPSWRVRLRVFGRAHEYQQYASTNALSLLGNHSTTTVSNLAGYYSVNRREVVTWTQRDPSYLANNILHECSHAILHSQFRNIPVWLNEGSAEYFSFPRAIRDASDIRDLKLRWALLETMRRDGALPKLRTFVNLTPAEFRAMPAERSYTSSLSLFQLLMSTRERKQALNTLLRRLQQRGTAPTDCAPLLDELYPGGLARMETDWPEWIARGATNVLSLKAGDGR